MRRYLVQVAVILMLLTAYVAGPDNMDGAPSPSATASRSQPPAATFAPLVTSAPRFVGRISAVGHSVRRHLLNKNWHAGCPVSLSRLRVVRVSYWDFDGEVRIGPLVVNRRVVRDVLWVFRQLFRARFPIHRIGLAPRPQPIDWDSRRNLTSSFNCRAATGNPGSLSQHSYGWAIDINPLQNPYVLLDGTVLRAAAKPYRDRSLHRVGMIHPNDVVVRSFAKIGWKWGGNWHTLKDYMHFSLTGR
jgi:hypothetical protein